MAMKEKIKIQRDLELKNIHDSEHLSHEEKAWLTGLITDAAECTNGLNEQQKVQNLSETTFGIVAGIIKITQSLNENNLLTKHVCEKVNTLTDKLLTVQNETHALEKKHVKNDIKDLDWKDTVKLVLVKPWAWIFLSVVSFSPKGLELVRMLLNATGHGN